MYTYTKVIGGKLNQNDPKLDSIKSKINPYKYRTKLVVGNKVKTHLKGSKMTQNYPLYVYVGKWGKQYKIDRIRIRW